MLRRLTLACACAAALGTGLAGASVRAAEAPLSPEMRAIEVIDQRGESVDPELSFVDHTGAAVRLGDRFDGKRAVIVSLNYYRCRVVCSVQLNGLADGLRELEGWTPGDENFRIVTVSMDPRETPEDAAKKRGTILASLGRGEDVGWDFLTGSELQIRALASQLGISYAYDAETDQYAHPGVLVFLTPDGRVSRYVYGLSYAARDLKLGVLEAGEGEIGSPVEQLYLSCFQYDASIGRYGPWAFGVMRIGGALIVLVLGTVLAVLWRRERRSRSDAALRKAGPVEAA
jgi:protein SCO1